ncbi:transcriptional regulator, GntR family [Renibacterium salmoninarum ATCC 33209]|uniref:Transcriptional regulator, GntR family n=1 Tax=Renibacterium salmoninarum (strain ATCC 33209 / DSM 20767 / JCM 11484 / NBRC 15589 / NCIMB 2235) TaxID=288705 RepID=A9WKW4_RENSM|nr:transcriptional regulator, GntR family [Renibacterium salmoninarum ATCC 33209]
MPLNIPIDRSSPVPLYHQVVQGIEAEVHAGKLPPGSRIDNEIELAAQLKLSRPTMRKAMDELVRAGLLVRKRGVGTQVVSRQVRRPLELSSLYDDLIRDGGKPSTQVLGFAHIEAAAPIREKLELAAEAKVFHFSRLRKVGRKPLALMENWVRDDVADLDEAALKANGLYALLREAGINFSLAHQRIGATIANKYQATQLGTDPGAALVTMERTAVDDTGRTIETGRHVYRADSYSFELTLVQR